MTYIYTGWSHKNPGLLIVSDKDWDEAAKEQGLVHHGGFDNEAVWSPEALSEDVVENIVAEQEPRHSWLVARQELVKDVRLENPW